ncbi:hypothetical protein C4D60_Mb01t27730 [Musa balbisiana]|uniref:Uncharacterized protein n=1 Tax=Musa balbisiana TaxID=52838 RepID=A0A4S8JR75_MUSBA|nr:hypothetical protein C4D60_Mb01t27730 [Musa balbisiana]
MHLRWFDRSGVRSVVRHLNLEPVHQVIHPVQFEPRRRPPTSGPAPISPPKETAGVVGEAQCVEDLKQTIAAATATATAESVFKAAGSFAEGHKKTVTAAAADSVFQSADSALSWIVSASSDILEEAKRASWMQHHNPAFSCGIAAGMGLVLLKAKC